MTRFIFFLIYVSIYTFHSYSNTTNEEWKNITATAIQNTAKELNSAMPLRSYVDIILKQIVEDLSNQVGRTNEAFTKRITETRYGKNVLEGIHNQTALKVNEMTRNITKIEKEIADKEGYLALVQMRLANRAQRPGVELCKDAVQDTLLRELETLRETVGNLNQMLMEVFGGFVYIFFVGIKKYNFFVFSPGQHCGICCTHKSVRKKKSMSRQTV